MAQEGFLIKQEKYLEAGIHIGTKLRVIDMTRFIYRTRNDGLYVLDLRKVDERIRMAGRLMAKYDPKEITVVASRAYSGMAAAKFAQITGSNVISGRFIPGRFTNVARDDFVEPKLVLICDPKGERQAVVECGKMGLPTVGLCDTDNFTMFIDWVVPCNNKGRRALALIFWLLAREMAMSSGKVASYDEFKPTLEEFEAQATETPVVAAVPGDAAGVVVPASEAPIAETESAPTDADAAQEVEEADEVGKEEEEAEEKLEAKVEGEAAKEGEEKKAKPAAPAKKAAPKAKPAAKKAEAKDEKKAEEKKE